MKSELIANSLDFFAFVLITPEIVAGLRNDRIAAFFNKPKVRTFLGEKIWFVCITYK